MIRLKTGVSLSGLSVQALLAMRIAEGVYEQHERTLWITSVNDSKHSQTSLHYSGNAFDVRTWNLEDVDEAKMVHCEIKEALGIDFDVIYEHDHRNKESGNNSHIHIEYQPRRK